MGQVLALRRRSRTRPHLTSGHSCSQATLVRSSMSGQYFAGTPFSTHWLMTLCELISWPRSLSFRISAVFPPATEIAWLMAACQVGGVVISDMPPIVDRKTIFASISIEDDDYSPGMNVHERIKDGRKRLGMTEEAFGAKVGVTRGSVQQWERGKTAPSRKRQPVVAALLGLTVAELMSESNVTEAGKAVTSGVVPLISWVQAGEWNAAADPLQPGDAERWLPCPTGHGPQTYALRVRGDSMTAVHGRSYPEGCIIYVDPDLRSPVNGARVIAKLSGSDEVTFKVFKEEDGRRWLQPLNPTHEPIRVPFRVLGTVIGKWEDE